MNLKNRFVALFGTLLFATQAFAGGSMIEVGVGGAALGGDKPVEALLKVEFAGIRAGESYTESMFLIGKLRANVAGLNNGINYLDIQFDPIQWGLGDENINGFMSVGSIDVQRNVAVGNDFMMRVTVVGFRGEANSFPTENLQVFVNGAVDLLGIGFTPISGRVKSGLSAGFQAEVGVVIAKKFRISLGEKLDFFSRVDSSRYVGTTCYDHYVSGYCDDYYCYPGRWETRCQDHYVTVDGDNRLQSTTSLNLVYDITKHFSVFGTAGFTVYVKDVIRDEISTVETTTGYQFFFGVAGKW